MPFAHAASQPKVVASLESALKNNRLAHAILFQGPKGSGQRETALELTKDLFCENKTSAGSCGVCRQCRQVNQGTHPDLYILEPEEDTRVIKIEPVREMIARSNLQPFIVSSKVFIIDKADLMNDVAQNALLKTLEEPAAATYFILISSNPAGLLATLRSRSQSFQFLPVLSSKDTDLELETLKRETLEYLLYGKTKHPDLSKLTREAILQIFDFLIGAYREILITRAGAGEILPSSGLILDRDAIAAYDDEETLADRIELLSKFKEKFSAQVNIKLGLSVFWDAWTEFKS